MSSRSIVLVDYLITHVTALKRRWKHMVGSDAVDDVFQETVVRSLKTGLVERSSSYLDRVAVNVGRDQFRRQRARGNAIPLEEAYDAPALAYPADQESALLLKQVILALPPLYRDVFILNRFLGLTYAEIAQKYGLSVKAVEYRMSRALALCEEALRD